MITLERFYFNPTEIEVTASSRAGEWALTVVPESNEGLHIKLSTLNRSTFIALLAQIQEVGQSILESPLVADSAEILSSERSTSDRPRDTTSFSSRPSDVAAASRAETEPAR